MSQTEYTLQVLKELLVQKIGVATRVYDRWQRVRTGKITSVISEESLHAAWSRADGEADGVRHAIARIIHELADTTEAKPADKPGDEPTDMLD